MGCSLSQFQLVISSTLSLLNIDTSLLSPIKSALGRVCNTHSSSENISGFDVTAWLQHLVLVPQMYSDRREATLQVHYWQTVYMALFVAAVLYFK